MRSRAVKHLILLSLFVGSSMAYAADKSCVPENDTPGDDKYGCFNILKQEDCIKTRCIWESMQSYEQRLQDEQNRRNDWFQNKQDKSTPCYANYRGNEKYKEICASKTNKEQCGEYEGYCEWQDTIQKKKKKKIARQSDNNLTKELCQKLENQMVYEFGARFDEGALMTTSMANLNTGKTMKIISDVGKDIRSEFTKICKEGEPIGQFKNDLNNLCQNRCKARTFANVKDSKMSVFYSHKNKTTTKYINICTERCRVVDGKIGFLNWGMNEAPMIVDQNRNCKQINDSAIHKIQKINNFIERDSVEGSSFYK